MPNSQFLCPLKGRLEASIQNIARRPSSACPWELASARRGTLLPSRPSRLSLTRCPTALPSRNLPFPSSLRRKKKNRRFKKNAPKNSKNPNHCRPTPSPKPPMNAIRPMTPRTTMTTRRWTRKKRRTNLTMIRTMGSKRSRSRGLKIIRCSSSNLSETKVCPNAVS